jgi:hypothetical protein
MKHPLRVLAVDPTSSGFAFAFFEGPEFLVDWGLKTSRSEKSRNSLRMFRRMFLEFAPDAVVLEDPNGKGSHRRPRIRRLLKSMAVCAKDGGVRVRSYGRAEIRRDFEGSGRITRREIARRIVDRFPWLSSSLPRERKWYDGGEDERMSIFDAASLAITFLTNRREGVVS